MNLHSKKNLVFQGARLLSVDPSLSCSGWALFCLETGAVKRVGTIRALPAEHSLSQRLEEMQCEITLLFQELLLKSGDYLVCEGPAPIMLNPKTAMKVEQVRGIFETVARSNGVTVPGRVNPRTVHVEILGLRGRQLERNSVKAIARETALYLYKDVLAEIVGSTERAERTSQDILDALLVGTVSINRIKFSLQSGFEVSESLEATRGRGRISDINRSNRTTKGNRKSWEIYFQKKG